MVSQLASLYDWNGVYQEEEKENDNRTQNGYATLSSTTKQWWDKPFISSNQKNCIAFRSQKK